MKRWISISLLALMGFCGLVAYVTVPVIKDLSRARAVLAGKTSDTDVMMANDLLERAHRRLNGPLGRAVRLIPVIGTNLDAADAIATGASRVLEAGLRLKDALKNTFSEGLMRDGAFDVARVEQLGKPLHRMRRAVDAASEDLQRYERSRWLLSMVQEAVFDASERLDEIQQRARSSERVLDVLPGLLGTEGRRRYLIVFMNYAEARGTGGIASGVGTLSVDNGRIDLGGFEYYGRLDDPPYQKVAAPPDLQRRYGRYRVASTHFANATMSPDVPEVATLTARVYERARGIPTDGVIFVDPIGLAAFAPSGVRTSSGDRLAHDEIPDYVSSRAYAHVSDQSARRSAMIQVGRAVLTKLAEGRDLDVEILESIGAAVMGGHIRFVPFLPEELSAMDSAGASGSLQPPTGDNLYVVVQNFGGDKLDHWLRQRISHACDIHPSEALCTTELKVSNVAPRTLPDYVTQGRKEALLRDLIELYIPSAAVLTRVDLNARSVQFSSQQENGHNAIGVFVELPRGGHATMMVGYRLPITDRGYRLDMRPQPMARPARLSVTLRAPAGWRFSPSSGDSERAMSLRMTFDEPKTITVRNPATHVPRP